MNLITDGDEFTCSPNASSMVLYHTRQRFLEENMVAALLKPHLWYLGYGTICLPMEDSSWGWDELDWIQGTTTVW